MKSHSPNAQANLVALWNGKYPIGTLVSYSSDGATLTTRTRSIAFIGTFQQACVLLEGFAASYNLTMCSPIKEKL